MSQFQSTPCGPSHVKASKNESTRALFHVNAQSARCKYELLMGLLEEFVFNFDVIMVTQTSFTDITDVIAILGYTSFCLNRSERRGGGVFVALRSVLSSNVIAELSRTNCDFEILTIKHGKNVISVAYHPPHRCVTTSFEFLDHVFDYVSCNRYTLYMGGDFNINLLMP